jgi:hypothetical protein
MRALIVTLVQALTLVAPAAVMAEAHQQASVPTFYVQHVGESNKSMIPFVIGPKVPEPSEIAKILDRAFWRSAPVFVLPEDDLVQIDGILEDHSRERTSQAEFHITRVVGSSARTLRLSRQKSTQVFRAIRELVSDSHPELRDHLAGTLYTR